MPDLSAFEDINKPVLMTLEDPSTSLPWSDEEGNVAGFMVYSRDSKIVKEETNRQINEIRKEQSKQNSKIESAEKIEARDMQLYATCVHSVINIQDNGKDIEADRDSIMKLFRSAPWIYEQLKKFADEQANFIKRRS